MIELIIIDYHGNLTISADQITGDKPFVLVKSGDKATLTKGDDFNAYYEIDRVLFINPIDSTGSIQLVGTFPVDITITLFDRNSITIIPSLNFKTNQLEIRYATGGLDALVYSEPLEWN